MVPVPHAVSFEHHRSDSVFGASVRTSSVDLKEPWAPKVGCGPERFLTRGVGFRVPKP